MLNFWKEYERMFLRCLLKEYEGLKEYCNGLEMNNDKLQQLYQDDHCMNLEYKNAIKEIRDWAGTLFDVDMLKNDGLDEHEKDYNLTLCQKIIDKTNQLLDW